MAFRAEVRVCPNIDNNTWTRGLEQLAYPDRERKTYRDGIVHVAGRKPGRKTSVYRLL